MKYLGKEIVKIRKGNQYIFVVDGWWDDKTMKLAKIAAFRFKTKEDGVIWEVRSAASKRKLPRNMAEYTKWLRGLPKEAKINRRPPMKPVHRPKKTKKGKAAAAAATRKIVKVAKTIQAQGGKKEVVSKRKVNKVSWANAVSKSAKLYRLSKKK